MFVQVTLVVGGRLAIWEFRLYSQLLEPIQKQLHLHKLNIQVNVKPPCTASCGKNIMANHSNVDGGATLHQLSAP